MATGMLIALLVTIYIVGYIIYYAADGWFGWTDRMYNDDKFFFLVFWPITIWWAVAKAIRNRIEDAKQIHDKKVAELARIRVQTEKELADTMKFLEEEIEEEIPRKRTRKSSRK